MTAEQLEQTPFIGPEEAERRARLAAQRAAQHPPNPRAALDAANARLRVSESATIAAAEAQQGQRAALYQELAARCPQQAQALAEAARQLQAAQADLAQAEQAVQSFESSAPASRADIQTWAAELARRRAERDGLALLRDRAQQAHQAAGAALRHAVGAQRDAEATRLRAELERRKAETDERVAALWKEVYAVAQEHNEAVAPLASRLEALRFLAL